MVIEFTSEEIQQRLLKYAQLHANRLGYRFGDGAESHFENLCTTAAESISNQVLGDGSPNRRELYIRQAEASLSYFVEGMISASFEIPGYRSTYPNIIGEETYWSARSIFCPCWPFC